MREQFMKKHGEFVSKMKEQDKALLKLINDKTRGTILNIIKDYLSQHES